MADEDLSLNEDQLLDNLEDANVENELLNEVSIFCENLEWFFILNLFRAKTDLKIF